MTWEPFDRSGHRSDARKAPHISFYKHGRVSLNAATIALLGDAEYVLVHVDRDAQLIGLERCDGTDVNAYTLQRQNREGGATASLTGFARQHRVKPGHYPASLDEPTGYVVARFEKEGE